LIKKKKNKLFLKNCCKNTIRDNNVRYRAMISVNSATNKLVLTNALRRYSRLEAGNSN